MSKIQQEILNSLYKKLADENDITDELLNKLKEIFETTDKPKVDDLIKIFIEAEDVEK